MLPLLIMPLLLLQRLIQVPVLRISRCSVPCRLLVSFRPCSAVLSLA